MFSIVLIGVNMALAVTLALRSLDAKEREARFWYMCWALFHAVFAAALV